MHINFFHKVILPKQKKCLILLNSKVAFPSSAVTLVKKKSTAPNYWHVSCTITVNGNSGV